MKNIVACVTMEVVPGRQLSGKARYGVHFYPDIVKKCLRRLPPYVSEHVSQQVRDFLPYHNEKFSSSITDAMMNAIFENKAYWKKRNTSIETDPGSNVTTVYLHENMIAEIGEDSIYIYNQGWDSKVTKERLNTILSYFTEDGHVFQRDHEWYINHGGTTQYFVDGYCFSSTETPQAMTCRLSASCNKEFRHRGRCKRARF